MMGVSKRPGSVWTPEGWARWHDLLLGGLVVLLGVGVYANSLPGAFIVDDLLIVDQNPLAHSLDLRAIFTSDYWGVGANRGLYRPITILSFALNSGLLGTEPWSYHLVNVLLHAWVGLAFFQLLRSWQMAPGPSFAAAALFAVHPIHTEVLNEVIGRSELLAALFYLLALRLAHSERRSRLWLSGGLYLLALLSKEHAVTFPAAAVLADLFWRRSIKGRLPFYGGLLAIAVLWFLFHTYGVDRGSMGPPPFYPIYSPLAFMPTAWRVLTACKLQLIYIVTLCWPVGLQGVYSGPEIDLPVQSLFSSWGVAIVLAVLATAALAVQGWRQRHPYGLAIALYGISFSVTANLFFPTEVAMAERFAYLPSLWFCLGVMGAFSGLWPRAEEGHRSLPAALLGFLVLVGLAGGATWFRNYDYRDGVTLFTIDFEKSPQNVLAGMFLGDAYVHRGEYGKAEEVYRKILAYRSDFGTILEDMAWVQLRQNRPREAVGYALKVVELERADLSEKVLMTLAESYTRLGQPAAVVGLLDMVAPGRYPPGFFWELLGKAYEQLGEVGRAVECYYKVGEPPLTSDVPQRLERLLRQLGQDEEAGKVREWIQERENVPGGAGQ